MTIKNPLDGLGERTKSLRGKYRKKSLPMSHQADEMAEIPEEDLEHQNKYEDTRDMLDEQIKAVHRGGMSHPKVAPSPFR